MEQLNIVGKRSGEGFVAHKATLVNVLSRGLAERLLLMDFTIGRKGFLGYIKSLSGSNVVKIVPATINGSASEVRTSDKRLKVVCGANTSYLEDMAWIGKDMPLSLADVRISPENIVKPNSGSLELAEALARVLLFTSKDDTRAVLQCVLFVAGEGKLKLASADGFRLAEVTLDYDEGEGKVLINRDELKGIVPALRKAKRVRIGFDKNGDTLEGMSLIVDTETTRYKWRGVEGDFPNYEQLIPTEFATVVQLDTVEALKAVATVKALVPKGEDYHLDLTTSEGQILFSNPHETGQAIIPADTDGQGYIRLDGSYLADVLRAFGGMVEMRLNNAYSPIHFGSNGFQVLVMPIMSNHAQERQNADKKASQPEVELEAEPTAELEAEPEVEAELQAIEAETKPKRRRSRRREKVAVA